MSYYERKYEKDTWLGLGIKVGMLIGVVTVLPYSCAKITEASFDKQDAIEAAENEGWQDPVITEINRIFPQLQGCGKDDTIGFELDAISPNGNEVDLVVCKGVFKAASVRQK